MLKGISFFSITVVCFICLWQLPTAELWLSLQGPGKNPENPEIVMLGDSHTSFVNWRILTGCAEIAGYGVGGNRTDQMLARLPKIIRTKPKLVMVMGGTNDALQGIQPQVTLTNIARMKQLANEAGSDFLAISPPPLPANEAAIDEVRDAAAIHVLFDATDLLSDHVHMRKSGYAKWRDAIAEVVKRYCQ